MNSEKNIFEDYEKPVAYDANGQPLYAHPPKQQTDLSVSTKTKHDRSVRAFPGISLSDGEYVISSIRRHPIGLFIPIALGVFLVAIIFTVLFNYDLIIKALDIDISTISSSAIVITSVVVIGVVLLALYVNYYVYMNNRMYLTNESVIQQIQNGLFSKSEQIVSLGNIEDASYTQNGIVQQIFDFGSIRLSTEGDETTYRFNYVGEPKEVINTLNVAIEDFKNFRPIDY